MTIDFEADMVDEMISYLTDIRSRILPRAINQNLAATGGRGHASRRGHSKQAYSTINARDDRIQTAATYREPFKKRRCLVPASGWYEWQKIDAKTKKPHHFHPVAQPFAFTGVWDTWKGDGKMPITTFSIVTTSPAPSTAPYHGRMPVVLEECQFEDWMRGPPELAVEMMKPYGGAIDVWEVGKDVGNVRNNKPELSDKVSYAPYSRWSVGSPSPLCIRKPIG